MFVSVLSDDIIKTCAISRLIEPHHVVLVDMDIRAAWANAYEKAVVVDYDFRNGAAIEMLRAILASIGDSCRKIFVVDGKSRWFAAQAFALGASSVVHRNSLRDELLSQLSTRRSAAGSAGNDKGAQCQAIISSAQLFSSMFAAVYQGAPIDVDNARRATSAIIAKVSNEGLAPWLENVRRHHRGTFQHCLIVTGVAVAYALTLKFPAVDVERLGLAATLHDIGKARTPVEILDKPGRLDPMEEEIVRRHPRDGYDALRKLTDLDPQVLESVLHHHEFLDGSGYPDKLSGSAIPDMVRLLTISDVFGALVEDRSYRPAMESSQAYLVLCSMVGKLDGDLVKSFKKVAESLKPASL